MLKPHLSEELEHDRPADSKFCDVSDDDPKFTASFVDPEPDPPRLTETLESSRAVSEVRSPNFPTF